MPAVLDIDVPVRPHCRAANDYAFEAIKKIHPSIVIMSAIWPTNPDYMAKLKITLDKLSETGIKTVVLGTSAIYKQRVPLLIIKKVEAGETELMSSDELELATVTDSKNAVAAVVATTSAKFVDVFKTICPHDSCPMAGADEMPYHFDIHHLTPAGSKYYAKELVPLIVD